MALGDHLRPDIEVHPLSRDEFEGADTPEIRSVMKGIHAVVREGSQIGSGCDESLEAVRRVGLSGHVSSSEAFGGDRVQVRPGAKQEGHNRNIIAHRSTHQRSESKELRLVGTGARFKVGSDEVGVTRLHCFGKIAARAASALRN